MISRFGITSKKRLDTLKMDNDIQELRDRAKKTDESLDKISSNIELLNESVNGLSQQVQQMQQKNDENEVARMGDRLTQGFNFYRKRGTWSTMEKWAFDNMVKQYKASGGDSWIDEVVVPASRSWEIVDE